MEKTVIGIIGCGTIANSAHIPAYLKNTDVRIKYFCDIIPEKASGAVEKYGCGTACTDYHDVINDPEVDAVSVCTPNRMHMTITCDALAACEPAEPEELALALPELPELPDDAQPASANANTAANTMVSIRFISPPILRIFKS